MKIDHIANTWAPRGTGKRQWTEFSKAIITELLLWRRWRTFRKIIVCINGYGPRRDRICKMQATQSVKMHNLFHAKKLNPKLILNNQKFDTKYLVTSTNLGRRAKAYGFWITTSVGASDQQILPSGRSFPFWSTMTPMLS